LGFENNFFFFSSLVDFLPLGSGFVDLHIFADPDPGNQNLADPDPKHWLVGWFLFVWLVGWLVCWLVD